MNLVPRMPQSLLTSPIRSFATTHLLFAPRKSALINRKADVDPSSVPRPHTGQHIKGPSRAAMTLLSSSSAGGAPRKPALLVRCSLPTSSHVLVALFITLLGLYVLWDAGAEVSLLQLGTILGGIFLLILLFLLLLRR